jgi:chemosensory pili system protein ChpC
MNRQAKSTVPDDKERESLKIRCLALTVHQDLIMLVPNTLVAEVVGFRPHEKVNALPEWVIGLLPWRGRNVPLVTLDRKGESKKPMGNRERHYVIFNTLNGNKHLSFIAMEILGIPHLVSVTDGELEYNSEPGESEPMILARLRYNGDNVIVPDLDAIERMLGQIGLTAA